MSKYYSVDEVESLLGCGCAYAIRELPTIKTSEDCISREWVLEEFEKGREAISKSEYFDELVWLVIHAPSVIPKPEEGEWVVKANGNNECSICGREKQNGWINFCGFCGARMRGQRNE